VFINAASRDAGSSQYLLCHKYPYFDPNFEATNIKSKFKTNFSAKFDYADIDANWQTFEAHKTHAEKAEENEKRNEVVVCTCFRIFLSRRRNGWMLYHL